MDIQTAEELMSGEFGIIFGSTLTIIFLITIVSLWKIFVKAGKPGWAALIPVYNIIVAFKVVKMSLWWLLAIPATYIPFVGAAIGIVYSVIYAIRQAQVFNKSIAFAIGLLLLPFIFLPILAFGKAEYVGDTKKI